MSRNAQTFLSSAGAGESRSVFSKDAHTALKNMSYNFGSSVEDVVRSIPTNCPRYLSEFRLDVF